MARPSKHDGVVYKRKNSNHWWMRYRDKTGRRRLESTNTTDWDEAQKQMRERLGSRDNNTLDAIRKGQQTTFDDWADFFLENYSKPPIRAKATHVANQAAMRTLRPMFGSMKLVSGDRCITDRGASPESAPAAAPRSSEVGSSGTRDYQADNRAPGVPGFAQGL